MPFGFSLPRAASGRERAVRPSRSRVQREDASALSVSLAPACSERSETRFLSFSVASCTAGGISQPFGFSLPRAASGRERDVCPSRSRVQREDDTRFV